MGRGQRTRTGKVELVEINMPTEKSELSQKLSDYSILLFGKKKIGKTTLAAEFPNVFYLPTEPGNKSISVFQPLDKQGKGKVLETWAEFCSYVEGYLKDRKTYGASCVDVMDKAYQIGFAHMCEVLGIEHPNDEKDYGKSWQAINNEVMRVIRRLIGDPRGCILISHEKVREVEDKITGEVKDVVQCSLSGRIHDEITGIVDIWAYYTYKDRERRLYIRGEENIDCGTRLTERFLDKESGEPLLYIPMGDSPKEGYENLLKAFDNDLSLERPKAGGGVKKKKRKLS